MNRRMLLHLHLLPLLLLLQVPGSINRHLRSYQREGVQFLFQMYCKGRGGVLSDDMGLGKTVQVRKPDLVLFIRHTRVTRMGTPFAL